MHIVASKLLLHIYAQNVNRTNATRDKCVSFKVEYI